jgi:phosphoadenosine phosphosulfate reductase
MDRSFEPRLQERTIAWTPQRLAGVADTLDGAPLEEILRWGLENFAPGICLATSFGPQSIVLMHQIARLRPGTTVFYLDTDLLFPETYALRDELARSLGLEFTRVRPRLTVEAQAGAHGPRLWSREPDRCCRLRKVLPLRRFLADKRAWITGIRNGQSRSRSAAALVQWDTANSTVKLNPLIRWTKQEVWDYIRRHGLPYNPLHEQGFPSIGCQPCTRAVQAGEDARAGRWPGFTKTECGIHPSHPGVVNLGAEESTS